MAKKKAKNKKSNTPQKQKNNLSFWKTIWNVITNKTDTDGEYTKVALTGLMSSALNTMAIALFVFAVVDICVMVHLLRTADWDTVIQSFSNGGILVLLLIFCVLFLLFFLIFALVLRGFANEIAREEDKNYIISVFSGLTGFAALIVALIALMKGVV